MISNTRIVLADTVYDVFQLDDGGDLDADSRMEPGAWIGAAVASSGLGNVAQATAEATQDSVVTTEDPLLDLLASGGGAAGAAFDVNDPGFPSRASGFGTTSLEVVFDVTEPTEIALAVSLFAALEELIVNTGQGPVDSEVFAFFGLVGANVGLVSSGEVSDDAGDGAPVEDDFVFSGVIAPDTYALTIGAQVDVAGFEDSFGSGIASFGFELRAVPEPPLAGLLLLGLWVIQRAPRRKR